MLDAGDNHMTEMTTRNLIANLVGFVVITPIAITILDGCVLQIMWGWFMTPTFHVPQLSIPQAIGLGLVVTFMTKNVTGEKKKSGTAPKTRDVVLALSETVLSRVVILSMGWVVQKFM